MPEVTPRFEVRALMEAKEHMEAVLSLIGPGESSSEYLHVRLLLSKAVGLVSQVAIDLIEGRDEPDQKFPF